MAVDSARADVDHDFVVDGVLHRREIRWAVIRHAERADVAFETGEEQDEYSDFPSDTTITSRGRLQAFTVGKDLSGDAWDVVIASPYFRCVQTAVEICKVAKCDLIIDAGWSEVGRLGGETRPMSTLAEYASAHGVPLRNPVEPCGVLPDDEESEMAAHARFGRCALTYLDRARRARTNFLVVSHGGALLACAQLFPNLRRAVLNHVDYCAHVLGALHVEKVEPEVVSTDYLLKQVSLVGTKHISFTPGEWSTAEPRYVRRVSSFSSEGSEIFFGLHPTLEPNGDSEPSVDGDDDRSTSGHSAGAPDPVSPRPLPVSPRHQQVARPKPDLKLRSKLFIRRSQEKSQELGAKSESDGVAINVRDHLGVVLEAAAESLLISSRGLVASVHDDTSPKLPTSRPVLTVF
jgi:broad specificity phosphatase PhoE